MNGSLRFNENCLITGRKCQRYFEASKRCFVACPSREKVGLELGIIEAKCESHNIEPYIAVDHRVPGKDVFCEKICSQIIESKFCIVLLKHDKLDDVFVPNANVYHEYGLMVGLRKKLIPVIDKESPPFFNIQGIDTIFYTPDNFEKEIENAIRAAVLESLSPEEPSPTAGFPPDVTLSLGLSGWTFSVPQPGTYSYTLVTLGADLKFFVFEKVGGRSFLYAGLFQDAQAVDDILIWLRVLLNRIQVLVGELDAQIMEMQARLRGPQPSPLTKTGAFRSLVKFADKGAQLSKDIVDVETFKDVLSSLEITIFLPENLNKDQLSEGYGKMESSFKRPTLNVLNSADIRDLISEEKKRF